jgi:hypothetical protein
MTPNRQQEVLAASLGVDPREVDLAIRLMRTGRTDLITKVTTGRLTIRQALQNAQQGLCSAWPSICGGK